MGEAGEGVGVTTRGLSSGRWLEQGKGAGAVQPGGVILHNSDCYSIMKTEKILL